MNLFNYIKNLILQKIYHLSEKKLIKFDDSLISKLIIGPPINNKHGDIYTNAALIIGKFEKKNPLEISKILIEEFYLIEEISTIEVVAPGFINFKLKVEFWYKVLFSINILKNEYGKVNLGNNEKINIEFVSANPTGPLHIGHARGAIFGDVLSNLLEWVGYKVTREYYINDAGNQITILAQSVYMRYKEILGENIIIEEGLYPGEYLKDVAQELFCLYQDSLLNMSNIEKMDIIQNYTLDYIMNLIKDDMHSLGIYHNIFTSEKQLHNSFTIDKCIAVLQEKGLIYYGVPEKPKSKEYSDWSPRRQMLFQSTKFGDDVDRALTKEDGSWTYFAGDIAYHFDKISRGFCRMILELGSDHAGYVTRLKSAVKALSDDKAILDVKLHNIVNFLENGEPVKMSKRKGEFLTVKDVVKKVGKDITRFIMLTRRNDMVLDFDFAKVIEKSRENPIFYVQYAYARVCSLMRHCSDLLTLNDVDFTILSSDEELLLIKLLAKWPEIVELSAKTFEPHRIAFYLIEVAEAFHVLWGYGNNNANMRFIIDDDINITSVRMYLAKAVSYVIASGLAIFSISPLEEMS
ncbi:arginine--tRNA ligase [Neoehrlichia mikurensis]|uniref:Arginine--tRNA ligase n=1 Tax=Neoehrlichia mikurensis TaxID=89586 RepID=A0A9Q9BUM9_9RICK|nr:arginine--tRNA ligase [Neoehrlichia mikurensis]QXK91930.1 arginine--tRNA ligase [Neoehrlichia mikurensis]QXK93143.1 arginine--tRNA ligase [Neoehrlichia mikurensis]QXK93623.1 arginine--tRNA ligase [Neoehrlichia mikurensis]UTO55421.1 arginine--tRNA ligase [Neoehrlichia mikurensis]UTO56341.1 arginine--tRNA ligase [Neoehrlichia mikurensis]